MPKPTLKRYSKEFGKKEKVLNYACQTYQLSRPNKVGTVMALIRECQPKSFEEWQKWYFQNANTDGKTPSKITKECPNVKFVESDPELDHAGDIDYLGWVGKKAFGIQIKPVTAKANFGNYSPTERMKASFNDFTEKFGGKVFIVFSIDDEIQNVEVIKQIAAEIKRLSG